MRSRSGELTAAGRLLSTAKIERLFFFQVSLGVRGDIVKKKNKKKKYITY